MKKRFINSIAAALVLTAIFLAFCKKEDNTKNGLTYGSSGTGTSSTSTSGTSTGGTTGSTTGSTTGYTTGYGDSTHFPVKQVNVFGYHFSPADISIPVGTSVNWTNRDSIAHTVSSRDGAFDSGDLGPGKNFFVTFPTEGYHSYYCKYHKEGGNVWVH